MRKTFTDMQDVWRRFRYAQGHQARLEAEAVAWTLSKENEVKGEFVPRASQYEFRLTGDLPSKRLSLMLGDVLHGYRSTLDNLVHQLLRREGATFNPRAAFRVCLQFEGEQAKRYERECSGLRESDMLVLDKYQPRTWGRNAEDHPLALLDAFSNADKHRVLIPSVVAHRRLVSLVPGIEVPLTSERQLGEKVSNIGMNIPSPRIAGARLRSFGPGTDPADPKLLYRVELVNLSTESPSVELVPGLQLHVVWREGDVSLSLDNLHQIGEMLSKLIEDTEDTL